jgi:hypothetical protein
MTSLVIAGAGAPAMDWILGVAGASRTVLDIQVPYASSAMIDYLGSEPEQYVSEQATLDLARAAYRRAVRLREGRTPVVGLSCSATIATDRPKRGDHRCHVSAYDATGWTTSTLTLTKGLRTRDGEDDVVSRLVLNSLAESFGLSERIDPGLSCDEQVVLAGHRHSEPMEALSAGHIGHLLVREDGMELADERFSGVILSGSFNPLHEGHTRLVNVASRILGKPSIYEISISNVDKPDLEHSEIRRRVQQFRGKADIAITRVPVFYEKARLFPGSTFVIGYDTMTRLVDPGYYGKSQQQMRAALSELRDLRCDFMVAGRVEGGSFKTLEDLPVPPEYEEMFTQIPESAFREDISSTQIRNESLR